VPKVAVDVLGEHPAGAVDEARRPVGEFAGAAADHHGEPAVEVGGGCG
jgi:hypothetical protein